MAAAPIIQGPLPTAKGTAAAGGGTFVATIPVSAIPYTNRIVRIRFEIYLSNNALGPLADGAGWIAECLVANKAGVTAFLTAIATSSNPVNSNTVGFALTSRPVASDAAFNAATALLTIAGNNVVCTVTNNNGGGVSADVTIVPYATVAGSV